jgi:hypothetical protein
MGALQRNRTDERESREMIGISVGSRAGGWDSTQELAHAHSGICRAVALGWQVAQLFHSPVHRGPACDPERGDHLPGRSDFPGASQSTWLGEQIQSQMGLLVGEVPPVLAGAMSDVLTLLTDPDRSRDATLDAVFTLHCRLLEALSVADFLLGKAYGLGRAIAETTLLPANASTGDQRQDQFRSMFESGRLMTIKDWLADLKTLLPDHTAYAVSRGLHDWQQWVAENPPADDRDDARSAIRVQGRVWRELLTGEKAARDVLSLSDYLATARRGAGQVLRRFWWAITGTAVLAAGIIYAGSYLHAIPDPVRVAGGIAWLAGAAGLFSRAVSVVLGQGITRTEGWLWQIELDGSVAAATTYLPPGARKSPAGGAEVGELTPDPDRAAEFRRRDQLRRHAEGSVQP